jgi:glycosyltransferase involved in cell wall biosynthesis
MFYSKFPQYRWITFRDMRGLSELEFAQGLKDSFSSVWIDSPSAFGTFPLESMKMGVPVIGLTPSMVPEWMKEENGIWINNQNLLLDVLADFIQNWLEDNINPDLYDQMSQTVEPYSSEETFKTSVLSLFEKMMVTRIENFKNQLTKFETVE